MSESDPTAPPRFHRINAEELARRLDDAATPLLLDVRRGAAFDEQPGIPAAIPFALDVEPSANFLSVPPSGNELDVEPSANILDAL